MPNSRNLIFRISSSLLIFVQTIVLVKSFLAQMILIFTEYPVGSESQVKNISAIFICNRPSLYYFHPFTKISLSFPSIINRPGVAKVVLQTAR